MMETKIIRYNLEDRLVKFSCSCLEICDLLPNTKSANNLEYQLSRSGISPSLLYGEAQAAESRADFIHKMKIALKELRETRINLRIILEKPLMKNDKLNTCFQECNELIAILSASITTAKENQKTTKKT
jgi:four helix bundle protein